MRKLIILRGNSGSGKTTIAKELQDKFDSLENYDVVAEMLLWANYIMGSRI